jgi:hypothetical protein
VLNSAIYGLLEDDLNMRTSPPGGFEFGEFYRGGSLAGLFVCWPSLDGLSLFMFITKYLIDQ